MERVTKCPICGSSQIRQRKCADCGAVTSDRLGLPRAATEAPDDYSDLSDYEVMRQILAAVRSIRAMVLFFTILAIFGIIVQVAVLTSAP